MRGLQLVAPLPARVLPAPNALRVAKLELSVEAADRQLESDWQARAYRRAAREHRRLGVRRVSRCPRCRLFETRAHCRHCGHVNTGTAT